MFEGSVCGYNLNACAMHVTSHLFRLRSFLLSLKRLSPPQQCTKLPGWLLNLSSRTPCQILLAQCVYTMRLLALDECDLVTGHLSLRTFNGTDIPAYAILSHRWTDDEVLFKDIEDKTSHDRAGYFKLQGAISQARADGYAYLWDDTCCIDKSSSAELSEAINSMWVWYQEAATCYAYLCDVPSCAEDPDFEAQVRSSGWFTRGWTLQELIAPRHVDFYNGSWASIGTRQTLQETISDITGIDAEYLNHARPLSAASIAKRMSWAAHRQTTRLEDIAYCLMGLFAVNMPMLYGEGSRAFQRLQEEILRSSDDESIFAWVDKNAKDDDLHGLLADDPRKFEGSGCIGPLQDQHVERKPLQSTNLGLSIQRGLVNGRMPLLCGYRGRAGYLSVVTTPVGRQYARCQLAQLPDCAYLEQTGNLSFPQVIPHMDRFHPMHETVIQYSTSVSHRTKQDNIYVELGQQAKLHPMSDFHQKPAGAGPFKVYQMPKFGTYMDFFIKFKRTIDQTSVFVVIGIVDAKELAFIAGAGDPGWVDYHYYPGRGTEMAQHSAFNNSALSIGSTFDVGKLHRVSVRQLPVKSDSGPVVDDQIRRLEIEITALEVLQAEQELRPKDSCCSVQ